MNELIYRQDVMKVMKNEGMSELEKAEVMSELPVVTPEGFRLKPCPFCGGKAVFVPERNKSSNRGIGYDFKIECRDCRVSAQKCYEVEFRLTEGGFMNPHNDERKQAAFEWNRRADFPKNSS